MLDDVQFNRVSGPADILGSSLAILGSHLHKYADADAMHDCFAVCAAAFDCTGFVDYSEQRTCAFKRQGGRVRKETGSTSTVYVRIRAPPPPPPPLPPAVPLAPTTNSHRIYAVPNFISAAEASALRRFGAGCLQRGAAPPNDPSPDRHSKLSFTGAASLTLTLTWRADAVDAASGNGRRSPPSSAPRPRRNLMAHLFSPQRMSTEASAGGWQQLLDDDEDAGETDRLSEAGTLEVVVRSASGLLAVDQDGMSDPYVSVTVGSLAPWSSQVVSGSLEPRWNESYRAKGRLGELIAAGAAVNQVMHDGWTPLHVACAEGHLECVQLLSSHGASRTISSRAETTAEGHATAQGHDDLVAWADPSRQHPKV